MHIINVKKIKYSLYSSVINKKIKLVTLDDIYTTWLKVKHSNITYGEWYDKYKKLGYRIV